MSVGSGSSCGFSKVTVVVVGSVTCGGRRVGLAADVDVGLEVAAVDLVGASVGVMVPSPVPIIAVTASDVGLGVGASVEIGSIVSVDVGVPLELEVHATATANAKNPNIPIIPNPFTPPPFPVSQLRPVLNRACY